MLTTFLAPAEAEVRATVGWPDAVAVAAAVPLGRPVKQLTKLKRNPVEAFVRVERWDGPPLARES